jgi:hypothetical protein
MAAADPVQHSANPAAVYTAVLRSDADIDKGNYPSDYSGHFQPL